jgi:hypothetical protein
MQEKYLVEITERFQLPLAQFPLLPYEIKGLDMLARLGDQIFQNDHLAQEFVTEGARIG